MKTGVQGFSIWLKFLDSDFRRNDLMRASVTFYELIKTHPDF
jgi:hypothetical protein